MKLNRSFIYISSLFSLFYLWLCCNYSWGCRLTWVDRKVFHALHFERLSKWSHWQHNYVYVHYIYYWALKDSFKCRTLNCAWKTCDNSTSHNYLNTLFLCYLYSEGFIFSFFVFSPLFHLPNLVTPSVTCCALSYRSFFVFVHFINKLPY